MQSWLTKVLQPWKVCSTCRAVMKAMQLCIVLVHSFFSASPLSDQWPPTSLHNKDEEWMMKGNSCISKFLFHGHLEKDLWYSLHQAAALQSLCSKDLIRILFRHAALHSPYFTTTHNIKLVRNAYYWELKILSDCVSTISWNCEGLWQ